MLTSVTVTPTLKLPLLEVKRSLYLANESPSKKIKPIPLMRRNILNNCKRLGKFMIEGNKYFSKLSGSGEKTQTVLKKIRKSKNIKLIKKFEFDPYLCEESNLKTLIYVFKNLKDTTSAEFIFRRVDYKNETNVLLPFIYKLPRLLKLRFEFPKTAGIDDKGFINLHKAFAKILSIKKKRVAYIEMQDVSELTYFLIPRFGRNKSRVEDISVTIIRKGEISDTQDHIFPDAKNCKKHHLKKLTFHCGIKSGWFSMSPEAENTSINFLKTMSAALFLSSINLKFSSTPVMDAALTSIAEILPKLKLLRHFSLELSNCKVSDTEMCIFAQSLQRMTQIEQFTLKVIQYPNLFENSVLYFATLISKMENFKKFDLYFRRLSTEEDIMKELVQKISLLENTKCDCHKQSLHIYRD